MESSRTKNTFRIILAGLLQRFVGIVFPFINRTILIYTLGVEFAGISSLFLSILSVLSLAELGFNSAIVYSMYAPVAEKDVEQVSRLLTLYRRVYQIVGAVILTIGVLIMPFLPYFIGGQIPDSINLNAIYILYLINTVIGYFFFSYRESILLANQRQDLSHIIRSSVIAIQYIVQALVLLVWHSFYLYLITAIVFTVVINLCIARESRKKFPQYHCLKGEKLTLPEPIRKQVGALLISKICDQARNSLDSVILSAFLGLTMVAVYNNYYFIYAAIYGIVLIICNGMGASVGNSIACESVEKNYRDLQKFSFMAIWFFGWCTVCLLCLYQPFMEVWVGKGLMLSDSTMALFCVYFYAININNVRNQYTNGAGIWDKLKVAYLVEAGANVILNIVLGKLFGISGIITATIITIIASNFIWGTWVLFRTYFKGQSLKKFFVENIYWAFGVFCTAAATYFVCSLIRAGAFASIFINGVICIFLPNLLFYLFFCRTEQFQEAKQFAVSAFYRIKNKI